MLDNRQLFFQLSKDDGKEYFEFLCPNLAGVELEKVLVATLL